MGNMLQAKNKVDQVTGRDQLTEGLGFSIREGGLSEYHRNSSIQFTPGYQSKLKLVKVMTQMISFEEIKRNQKK